MKIIGNEGKFYCQKGQLPEIYRKCKHWKSSIHNFSDYDKLFKC